MRELINRLVKTSRDVLHQFVRANPRTAASAIAAVVLFAAHVQAHGIQSFSTEEGMGLLTLLVVAWQGLVSGDAKKQIPASEVRPDTNVSVSDESTE